MHISIDNFEQGSVLKKQQRPLIQICNDTKLNKKKKIGNFFGLSNCLSREFLGVSALLSYTVD